MVGQKWEESVEYEKRNFYETQYFVPFGGLGRGDGGGGFISLSKVKGIYFVYQIFRIRMKRWKGFILCTKYLELEWSVLFLFPQHSYGEPNSVWATGSFFPPES